MAVDQVGRKLRQEPRLTIRPASFDRHVVARHVTGFRKASAEGSPEPRAGGGRPEPEKPDHGRARLPRASRNWPAGRQAAKQGATKEGATKEGHELAPSHASSPAPMAGVIIDVTVFGQSALCLAT